MKLLLLSLLFCVNAFAQYDGFNERALQNKVMEASEYSALMGDTDGKAELQMISKDSNMGCHTARFTWDFADDGGAIGVASLGVTLPKDSIIRKAFVYSKTLPVSAGSGTMAFACEDANNILTATDVTAFTASAFWDGAADESDVTTEITSMIDGIGAECEITATIASAAYTAGKLIGFVDYCSVE